MGQGYESSSLKPHILKHHIPEHPTTSMHQPCGVRTDHEKVMHVRACVQSRAARTQRCKHHSCKLQISTKHMFEPCEVSGIYVHSTDQHGSSADGLLYRSGKVSGLNCVTTPSLILSLSLTLAFALWLLGSCSLALLLSASLVLLLSGPLALLLSGSRARVPSYFCSGPISVDPICPQPSRPAARRWRCSAPGRRR